MNFALVYIIRRIFYRIWDFFHHWYVDGSRRIFHNYITNLENVDKAFAVRITFRYLFQPLYKDYSIVGRILGPIFRSGRVLIGGGLFVFWTIVYSVIYLLWILFPPALLFYSAFPSALYATIQFILLAARSLLVYVITSSLHKVAGH